jgi:polar amino acid transport system permease protein
VSVGGPLDPGDLLDDEDAVRDRRPRILGGGSGGAKGRPEGRRAVVIAIISTIVFFGVIIVAVVNSSGWAVVKQTFFNGEQFKESFPGIARAFLVNVKLFMIAEVFILAFALLLAIMRSLAGPVFFPIRALSIVYVDLFRGIPTILVIYTLGFGAPALDLAGVPKSAEFWAVVSLVLVYSAYVAEVYRAGIESVHESQVSAARSLGLSRWQSLRFVVLPQAIRRVIPPLLNDFIGLQKDTALVSVLGVVEAARQAGIDNAATFNYTPFLATALLFVSITIPLTRFTDWLIARGRRRRQAGGVR